MALGFILDLFDLKSQKLTELRSFPILDRTKVPRIRDTKMRS